jgi:hypothetical protein
MAPREPSRFDLEHNSALAAPAAGGSSIVELARRVPDEIDIRRKPALYRK